MKSIKEHKLAKQFKEKLRELRKTKLHGNVSKKYPKTLIRKLLNHVDVRLVEDEEQPSIPKE